MTDHRNRDDEPDELIARLQAADPQRTAVVAADTPAARALFQELMMTEPGSTTPTNPYTVPVTAGRANRSRWVLVGGGVAVAAASSVALVISRPGDQANAAALVAQATEASTAAAIDQLSAVTTFDASGLPDLPGLLDAGTAAASGTLTTEVSGDDLGAALVLDGGMDLEVRIVDGVTYWTDGGGTWTKLSGTEQWTDLVGGESAVMLPTFDPRDAFGELLELTDAELVGTETIDGLELTHYRGVSQLGTGTSMVDGWYGDAELFDGPLTATVDLFVAEDGLLRRIEAEAVPAASSEGTSEFELSFSTELTYTDDVRIEVPPNVSEFELPQLDDLSEVLGGLSDLDLDPAQLQADLALLFQLQASRPGLCVDELGGLGALGELGAGANPAAGLDEASTTLVECLRDAGEDEAADAAARLAETAGSVLGD